MPSRTYIGIDFINYSEGFVFNVGTAACVATPVGNFNTSISGIDSGVQPPDAFISTFGTYDIFGELDFDAFPAIPDNASITRVTVKIDATVAINAVATGVTTTTTTNSYVDTYANASLLPDIRLEVIDSNSGVAGNSSIVQTEFDHYTATQDFDFTGSPITKGQLITDFTNWQVRLNCNSVANANVGPGTSSLDDVITIDGIQIQVTYESGAEISLSPAGGNVEQGQTITASGPNAADLEYAIIIGDLIIPIIPKIINQDEVLLEVPYPPTDPCFDCFGDCPECETCFTVCDNDLVGEDCQACLDACLACLTTCLEDLQLAEECQQSTGATPPIPGVVICGTRFSGTVTLGNFTILVANGSGLYTFEIGKANDTLYTAARDGTTYDVKIPNPGAKTGFFRS
jgi:hypothetical protein